MIGDRTPTVSVARLAAAAGSGASRHVHQQPELLIARAGRSRGVVDAVVVERGDSLKLEIPVDDGGRACDVHNPDDAVAVGYAVTIRYDP